MYYQNPYYQMTPFVQAMQQNYTPQQQSISTQPPILQPMSKVVPVSNKDEANAYQVDLIYGQPTFFYNKSKNEIYVKKFDVQNGNAIFKTYGEMQSENTPKTDEQPSVNINPYQDEFNRLNEGINSLHRMIAKLQENKQEEIIEVEPKKVKKNA